PRLIRVAMMYNDKVGYGPTVSTALDGIFGAGAGATATGPAPATGPGAQPPAARPGSPPPPANVAEVPTPPVAVVSQPGNVALSPAKAAALQELESAMTAVRDAQRSGNFAQYGSALQQLSDAMNKYDAAK
ncbi:MAG TPA: membrane protein, partial [Mycobacterium sp.]|nr:membrane protein [Mycobacterium sp.]